MFIFKNIFHGVTCENLTTSNALSKTLHVNETHYLCLNDMELHKVTPSVDIKYSQYCGNSSFSFFLALCHII